MDQNRFDVIKKPFGDHSSSGRQVFATERPVPWRSVVDTSQRVA